MADNKQVFPMISEASWWTLRKRFQASIPSEVSTGYVKSLLSMSSDSSAFSNVINPMKQLGLIDTENKPTELSKEWRMDDSYKGACNKIIKLIYPDELLDLFPGDDVDKNMAKRWFMSKDNGSAAAGKMTALFVLLKNGQINNDKNAVGKKPTQINSATRSPKIKSVNKKQAVGIVNDAVKSTDFCNSPNVHIDLQIHISPESTTEQIEAIFHSMAKHLYNK